MRIAGYTRDLYILAWALCFASLLFINIDLFVSVETIRAYHTGFTVFFNMILLVLSFVLFLLYREYSIIYKDYLKMVGKRELDQTKTISKR
jgi:hypothetical protein